jgi:hypothetical protein
MSIKGHITCHITGTKGLVICQVHFKSPIAPLNAQNMFWNAKVKKSDAKGRW